MDVEGLVEALSSSGTGRGDAVAVVADSSMGVGLATAGGSWAVVADAGRVIGGLEDALRPRWVLWSNETAVHMAAAGVRVAAAWDVSAVHRLLHGGWAADPARVWAAAHGLAIEAAPTGEPRNLFSPDDDDPGDPEDPVRPDGYLRPEWVSADWRAGPERLRRWAEVVVRVAGAQLAQLAALVDHPTAGVVAHSESAAGLLCAELSLDGLPMDRGAAEAIISRFVGPRPSSDAEAEELLSRRDRDVLRHLPSGVEVDLRSSAQVKALLGRLGIMVADTRAWRLRAVQDRHPVVGAFLAWRKAERVATTYGYAWLDTHLGADGRLRGTWAACDGAAGRMTASAGLHNMPADLRPAVVAEPAHVFVRADLGQIEPRVLAAISRDTALARATLDDDLYLPVAAELGVDREIAKVAVLGAMYGQTTGHGARVARRLAAAYPVAMGYLRQAAVAGEAGRDLRTYGGRLVRMGSASITDSRGGEPPGVAAARGRYGRNAVIQGAAAELFKIWAVTVRARGRDLNARIVLCLHDELLVQAPIEHAPRVAQLLGDCLHEAVHRWAPGTPVRFVADISVIARWSDAKATAAPGS